MVLHDLAIRYGPEAVFVNVLGASLGLPVPALPTLIVVEAALTAGGFGETHYVMQHCSRPNEVSAAWMAKQLMELGFKDVVPLTGGLDAWRIGALRGFRSQR